MKIEAVRSLEKHAKRSRSPNNSPDPLQAASPEEPDCSSHLISAARLHSRAEFVIPSFHLSLRIALGEAHENIPALPLPSLLNHNNSLSWAELLNSLAC